jgi:hypothetical protein
VRIPRFLAAANNLGVIRLCHHFLQIGRRISPWINRGPPYVGSDAEKFRPRSSTQADEAAKQLASDRCSRCAEPIVRGQHVAPLFSAKLIRWSEHPVLSKPPVIRGIIPTDGSPARVDMSVRDQLRQRAAMGGERERAELAALEALLSKCIAEALVAQLRKEAEAHGVDVVTWLMRDKSTDDQGRFEPGDRRVDRICIEMNSFSE